MKKQILFTAFEAAPFIKTGGLGDVAGSLPAAIKSPDYDIRVMLPLLSKIPQEYKDKMKFVCDYEVPLGWRNIYCGLFRMRKGGVTYYFLDNEYYFHRDQVYGEFDDGERVAFFSKACLETLRYINGFDPDIIHTNDWHTALIPVFLHEHYRGIEEFQKIKTVFTIHNLQFQGKYDKNIIGDILGLVGTPAHAQLMDGEACNYLQAAVIYSDMVTTVSPTYAENICTPEYGEGLEGLFNACRYKLRGIVNGIDYKEYNPATDKAIAKKYSAKKLEDKKANKAALQEQLGLPVDDSVPLFAIVSRLTSQKGMDFVDDLMSTFASQNMQLAILGTGDKKFEYDFTESAKAYPDKISASIKFSEPLSRLFYAGADCFMMPSVFEPCGLAQMMSMRYGTLPLVRKTGGLKDTVKGFWDYNEEANGFSFEDADTNGLYVTVMQALDMWENNPEMWAKLQQNGLEVDFSWAIPAEEYKTMYDEMIGE
ncbi:MAG: glycogen synthase GlgA [Eubacterium sp.]|nr:glycogen synthase GlgA [Candidatus Colimonas fimequi]